jgi:predicted PurR-regulated permease PerM
MYYGRLLLITLVIAVTIGFLLDPFVELLMKLRLPRTLASFLVCVIALLILYLVGLGAYTQVSVLIVDLPAYSERVTAIAEKISARVESAERGAYDLLIPKPVQQEALPPTEVPDPEPATRRRRSAEPPMPVADEPPPPPAEVPEVRIRQEKTPLIAYAYSAFGAFYDVILMSSFVPFLVYFMLSWKDHFRRSYLQLFQGQDRYAAGRSWEGIADMARAYVLGNFILGVLLSVVSTLFFWFMKLPYFMLVGPLSGFLSLIPYIGLPLAMVPPFFVALTVYERLTPYIIIAGVVGFIHLLALNLLYPKIVGSRVHVNPLVVTVALMFFGILWGGMGLVLAIPIAAGVKAVCDNVPDLNPYGKLLGD